MVAPRFLLLTCLLPLPRAAGQVLEPGVAVTGALLPGSAISYRAPTPGKMRVNLQQGDWEFALEVVDPVTMQLRHKVDAFSYGLQSATLVETPAVIRIRRADSDAVPATFSITLSEAPESDLPAAALRMRAEDASTAARESGTRASAAGRERAVELSREALELWKMTGDASCISRASILLADSLYLAASYNDALETYNATLPAADSAHSRAEILANRGSTYWRLGRFSEAVADMRDSLAIWRTLPLQAGLGNAYNNLGLVLWETGEYDDSLRAFQNAARVMAPLANRRGLAYVANNSALVEGTLGNYASSARFFEQAARLFGELEDHLATGRARTNSARIYLKLGQPERAENAVRRGLELVKAAESPSALAEGLNLLGEVLAARGRKDEALAALRQGLSAARSAGDPRVEANALTNIGRILLTTTGRDAGIAFLQDALRLWRRFGSPDVESSVLFHLAVGQRDRGDLSSARESIERALAIAETLRSNVSAVDLRVGFMVDKVRIYDAAVDIFERCGDPERAWRAAEMSRARGLYDLLAAERPPSESRRRLLDAFNSESVRLARGGSQDAGQARKRLDELTAELAGLREREDPPNALLAAQPPDLAAVERALPEDTAILEYAAGEPGYAWVIRSHGLFSFHLERTSALKLNARRFAELIQRGPEVNGGDIAAFDRISAALAAELVWPALRHLEGVSRLVLVADPRLDFPASSLPMPAGGVVAERFETTYAPSAASYIRLTAKNNRFDKRFPVAIFADGIFSSEDSRLSVRLPERSPNLPRLLFSAREAREIASFAAPSGVRLLVGFEDRREAFVSGSLGHYPVVHVSTHFVMRGRTPALVFSLFHSDGSPENGFLTPAELAQLDLRGNALLVLSACHSSAAPSVPGEGPQNMARAALLAGSARVIVTRWPVDDEASARLFGSFYTFLWRERLSPAAALRRAQLSLRQEPRFRSPYYWAAYYLVGTP